MAPDEGVTAQDQRNEFVQLLSKQTNLPGGQVDDGSKEFALLEEKTKTGQIIVLFDEIIWMAHGDPTFLAKHKKCLGSLF